MDSRSDTLVSNLGMTQIEEAQVEIRRLKKHELVDTLPLLSIFYPQLLPSELHSRLAIIAEDSWQCVGIFIEAQLVGLSGYWINTRLYCGKYLYIDHFIINPEQRSQGIGSQLLAYLKEQAEKLDCQHLCLDTFATNSTAQRFWTRNGFNIVGFHYVSK